MITTFLYFHTVQRYHFYSMDKTWYFTAENVMNLRIIRLYIPIVLKYLKLLKV